MSIKFLLPALDVEGLTAGAKLTFILIANHADNSGKSWPSQKALSDKVGCDAKTLRRYVKELVDMGYLIVTKRGARASVYEISCPDDGANFPNDDGEECPNMMGKNARTRTGKSPQHDGAKCPIRSGILSGPHLKEPVTEPVTTTEAQNRTSQATADWVAKIASRHPLMRNHKLTYQSILKAIEKGHSPEYLLARVTSYRDITAKYPQSHKRYIIRSDNFFGEERFLDDDAAWAPIVDEPQAKRDWQNDPNHRAG